MSWNGIHCGHDTLGCVGIFSDRQGAGCKLQVGDYPVLPTPDLVSESSKSFEETGEYRPDHDNTPL
jgi:hypothetical protein